VTVEALTYPLPRRNRTGPASSLDLTLQAGTGDSLVPPRSRIIPWLMVTTATSRRTISTPLLVGPAILRKLKWGKATITTPPVKTLEVGWSPLLITEAGVALTTVRPYTGLIELQDPFAVAAAAKGVGFPGDNSSTSYPEYEFTLDLIVTEARFCFTVSLVNNSAQAEQHGGHLTILEAVNAEALARFTGS